MNKPMQINHPLINIINSPLIDLPSSNISLWWNMGFLLSLGLTIQLITGIFLAMHYTSNIALDFHSINHICRDVNYGWLIRTIHANGASFFMCIYINISRGMYYGSYKLIHTWMIGVLILFIMMSTDFLGYVSQSG